ncbi:hypothetical protein [Prosthecobacter vanneervenii]|uniref:Uncharacterized protein n=1 Tax=Prosthecobacter vanneervenii TaxID=48466 RepID=A0A7W8DKF1_9BACT|nr:hypothetical protein [Prosthecobacter vanneervenii]MBB5033138.1 hypothetical protein [Prosthecobacter vanneervenii]
MSSLALQTSDHDAIGQLPAKWRVLFNTRHLTLTQFHNGQITKLEAMDRLHVSRATFDRLLARVAELGWAGLVPQYKGVGLAADNGLPAEFISFWKRLVESYQRKTAPAYRHLVRIWRAHQPFELQDEKFTHVPGYAGWPGWPNLPAGWGGKGRNLYRHLPKKLELTALRQGLGAAQARFAPKVLSTRVGLWHMSHVVMDDVKLDFKAHLVDSSKLVVPMQLGALDLLSGSRFAYGMKPQLYRADGTKAGINEGDMRFLLANILTTHGISQRGTTFVIEHGTAAIRGPVRDILTRAFGDLVQFSDSGFRGKIQALAGMTDGRGGGGNPNHKAALESLHNLIHNELAALPAQTGHDRTEPEWLGVIERADERLLALARRLPPEVMKMLRFRTFEWHSQLVPMVAAVLDAINKRDDHDLEGWAELGFITRQYRLMPTSSEWWTESQLMELAPASRQAILAQADADQRCWMPRRLSPHEVFEMGRAKQSELIKAPDSVVAEILYSDLAQPRRLGDDGMFEFEDKEIAPGVLTFEGRVLCPNGREQELQWGETYEVVINPFNPRVLWVYSGTRQRGAFLGIAKAVKRHSRADAEAAKEAFKRSNQRLAEALAETRDRNSHITRRETQRNAHNRRVITAHTQAQQDFTRRATALVNASTSIPAQETQTTHDHENTEPDW